LCIKEDGSGVAENPEDELMVNTKKHFADVLVRLGLLLALSGCAVYTGARSQMVYGNRITVQGLAKDWQNFNVYFTGHGRGHPSAVLFEPKEDGRAVIADRWWKVEQYEILADLIDSIQRQLPIGFYYPRLLELVGPDNIPYAYVFTSWDHVPVKLVDERTLFVYDIPLPPYLAIDGRDGFRERRPR
jgi:hypothetical protein